GDGDGGWRGDRAAAPWPVQPRLWRLNPRTGRLVAKIPDRRRADGCTPGDVVRATAGGDQRGNEGRRLSPASLHRASRAARTPRGRHDPPAYQGSGAPLACQKVPVSPRVRLSSRAIRLAAASSGPMSPCP